MNEPRTTCPECGARTWGAEERKDAYTSRYYTGCVACPWGEYSAPKSIETRVADRQCDLCRLFVPQWKGFPVEKVCCHCQKDPEWQRKIDYTKPLFLCV